MPLFLLECATHFVRSLAALRGELAARVAICPVVTEGNLVQIVLLIAKLNGPPSGGH
jgi:hypothetical protein